jgi:hypothetical protein
MHHLDIPRFSRNNRVLPSPTSTTNSTASTYESDGSGAGSISSLTSIGHLASPFSISQYHSEPNSLAEIASSPFHSSVHRPSGSDYADPACLHRASLFRERFDLIQMYPRDPFRQTIYQGESYSQPSISANAVYRQKEISRVNSAFKLAHLFRFIIRAKQQRKL